MDRVAAATVLALVLAATNHVAPTPTAVPTHAPFEATSRHPFDDVKQWVSVFDDPARDAWQKPKELVAALALTPGMTIADLGAGTGYFSRYLSRAVGDTGTVFAVDTEPNMVAHLRERAEQEQTANVIPVLASFDDPRLPRGAIDLVLIVDTFHHLDHRLEYLQRLGRALKPSGRVVIVDWQAKALPVGPPLEHKIARDQVVDEMHAAGYRLADEPAVLPYQYVLVFTAGGFN
jgi:ubiquinone/menaquinone biosynthesis C-methylase UbiE